MKRDPALVPLSRQHHDGLALGVYIKRGLRGSDPKWTLAALRAQALTLWEHEYLGHFAVEERFVFPVARKAIPDPSLVDALLADHEDLRSCFSLLQQRPPEQCRGLLLHLRERLVRHIRREERELFQALQASLDECALKALGEQVEQQLPAMCLSLGSAAA